MKKAFLFLAVIFVILGVILLSGCSKDFQIGSNNINLSANNANIAPVNSSSDLQPNINTAVNGMINQVLINDAVNEQGTVDLNQVNFSKETAEIFVAASIQGAVSGLVVTAELVYLPTGDKVGPVSNPPANGGDFTSNFSFTKPTNGWPAGNYNVNVTLSNGQAKTAPFIVQ